MKNGTITANTYRKRNGYTNFIVSKRNIIVETISALFILLFLYTALSKSFDINSTVDALKKTPGFTNTAYEVAWGVVILEYMIAILLFLPKTRKVGLYCSLFLMTAFTGYIGYMKAFVPDLPCSCGGVISKLSWNDHLIFNIAFTILALIGILLMRKRFKSEKEDGSISVVFT